MITIIYHYVCDGCGRVEAEHYVHVAHTAVRDPSRFVTLGTRQFCSECYPLALKALEGIRK